MFTAAQIMDKIRIGETSSAEFKEVRIDGKKVTAPHRDSLSDELAAFANQSGGAVIFGVADNTQQITGIDPSNISILVSYISEICSDSVSPPIAGFYVDSVIVLDEAGDEKYLVYVQIERSLWVHKSSNGYFYRHGNSKREMSAEYLVRLAQSRSQARIVPFDEQAVPNTNQDTLQKDLYMRFVSDDRIPSLTQRRLLVSHNDNLHATVAGILMCTPTPDQHIYNSYIQAVFYRGRTRDANYQINAKDFRGPLDQQIIGAYSFVSQHNQLSAKKDVGREEKPQYSMRAVFEALVNAVVHRDYSIHGSKIRLFMFADRLEFHSPGALANTLTAESLIDNQFTRNELLSRLLNAVLPPAVRWFPADEAVRETSMEKLMPPLVAQLRIRVKEFRDGGYAGASDTSRSLLNWWFGEPHLLPQADGAAADFQYYFAQREALETVVYLYDVWAQKTSLT